MGLQAFRVSSILILVFSLAWSILEGGRPFGLIQERPWRLWLLSDGFPPLFLFSMLLEIIFPFLISRVTLVAMNVQDVR